MAKIRTEVEKKAFVRGIDDFNTHKDRFSNPYALGLGTYQANCWKAWDEGWKVTAILFMVENMVWKIGKDITVSKESLSQATLLSEDYLKIHEMD